MQVHPSQIAPAESFDVFYYIRNHLDSATYYVQAVIYDVRTGAVLATHTLDQSPTNSRLYIKTVQAPPDPTGYGRNIVAIATVYTDNGYTTKSETYEEQEYYFLVKNVLPFFGGGGTEVDYDKVRKIVKEEVGKLPAPKPFPDMPWDAIFGSIGALQREVNRIPKENVDLAPLDAAVSEIKGIIQSRPKFEKTDLSALAQSLNELKQLLGKLASDTREASNTLLTKNETLIKKLADDLLKDVEAGLKTLMSRQELTIPFDALFKERPKEEEPADLTHLM